MLTSAFIYGYDISTVMASVDTALKSVTILRTAVAEFFTIWFLMDGTCKVIQKSFCE